MGAVEMKEDHEFCSGYWLRAVSRDIGQHFAPSVATSGHSFYQQRSSQPQIQTHLESLISF
jgi:hypothetical protein